MLCIRVQAQSLRISTEAAEFNRGPGQQIDVPATMGETSNMAAVNTAATWALWIAEQISCMCTYMSYFSVYMTYTQLTIILIYNMM